MFDVLKIASGAPSADVSIKHPVTGDPIGVTLTLAGPEHPSRKSIEFARQRRARVAIQRTGKFELNDPADDAQEQIDRLAACTLAWDGVTEAGVPVECTKAAAAALYATEGLEWLRDQAAAALDEQTRFIKACASV
jgi:hypothetical protein